MKQILRTIGGLLAGIIIGFGLVWLITGIVDNGDTTVRRCAGESKGLFPTGKPQQLHDAA